MISFQSQQPLQSIFGFGTFIFSSLLSHFSLIGVNTGWSVKHYQMQPNAYKKNITIEYYKLFSSINLQTALLVGSFCHAQQIPGHVTPQFLSVKNRTFGSRVLKCIPFHLVQYRYFFLDSIKGFGFSIELDGLGCYI